MCKPSFWTFSSHSVWVQLLLNSEMNKTIFLELMERNSTITGMGLFSDERCILRQTKKSPLLSVPNIFLNLWHKLFVLVLGTIKREVKKRKNDSNTPAMIQITYRERKLHSYEEQKLLLHVLSEGFHRYESLLKDFNKELSWLLININMRLLVWHLNTWPEISSICDDSQLYIFTLG